jgi:hypothetical protein
MKIDLAKKIASHGGIEDPFTLEAGHDENSLTLSFVNPCLAMAGALQLAKADAWTIEVVNGMEQGHGYFSSIGRAATPDNVVFVLVVRPLPESRR